MRSRMKSRYITKRAVMQLANQYTVAVYEWRCE